MTLSGQRQPGCLNGGKGGSHPRFVRPADDDATGRWRDSLSRVFSHAAKKLVARNRAKRGLICTGPPMGDREDQETPFQEMGGHRLAARITWARLLLREATKRGYTIQDILALLDELGMTAKEALKRILSTRKLKRKSQIRPPRR